MPRLAAALVLLVFAAGAAKLYAPWLTAKGPEVNSTPSLEGFTPAEVKVRAARTPASRRCRSIPAIGGCTCCCARAAGAPRWST